MKKLFPLLFLLLIISCNQEKNKGLIIPDNVIQKEAFIDLLVDVQIIEAGLRKETVSSVKMSKISTQYYSILFDKHQINKQKYDSSLNFYKRDIVEFDKIYQEVIKKLEAKKKVVLNE